MPRLYVSGACVAPGVCCPDSTLARMHVDQALCCPWSMLPRLHVAQAIYNRSSLLPQLYVTLGLCCPGSLLPWVCVALGLCCPGSVLSWACVACESWTLTAELQRRILAMEMRCYHKILRISYKDHVTNEEVLAKIHMKIS